jgi:hypothetical protein
MKVLTQNQINELYNDLVGTCSDIDIVLMELFEVDSITELSPATLEEIDQMMFNCGECGWWCDINESTECPGGDEVCEECACRK